MFALDRHAGELTRSGRRVHLAPQAITLLALLIEHAGEVVSRDDIRKALWADDTFVEYEAAVNACVSQIRSALGDSATAPRFIETLPRRGYRFTVPVCEMVPEVRLKPDTTAGSSVRLQADPAVSSSVRLQADLLQSDIAASRSINQRPIVALASLVVVAIALLTWNLNANRIESAGRNSVAVMPIIPDDENDRELVLLGNLLQERTLVELQSRSLGASPVLSRLATESLRGSGRSLKGLRAVGPEFWLDATLQRIGPAVRLHAKVGRLRDARILWTADLEYPIAIFTNYRDRFAAEFAERLLGAAVARPEWAAPIDTDTDRLVVRGSTLLENGDSLAALERLERAVGDAPGNLVARGVLARALAGAWMSGAQHDASTLDRARDEIHAVLRVAGDDSNALGALGAVQLWADWNLQAAGVSLERALATRVASSDVRRWRNAWLSATGRHDEAIADARRVHATTPISSGALLARALTLGRRYTEAIPAAREAIDLQSDAAAARLLAYIAQLRSGRSSDALATLVDLIRTSPERSDYAPAGSRTAALRTAQADALRMFSEQVTARQADAAFSAAIIAADTGEIATAIDWLARAAQLGAPSLALIGEHPGVDPLRKEPAFQTLLSRLRAGDRNETAAKTDR